MATNQASDPDVQSYRMATTSLQLADVSFDGTGTSLFCDISTRQPRPVFPRSWRQRVFRRHLQPLTPGQEALAAAGRGKVCVARAPERHPRLGQYVCGEPASKGPPPC
ncbi:hypothetical protein AAFF_G00180570 [Aldrovandia affinis]|uniref:Uncharacterized protein n=1 Tax=Aldrovandia affinis TaxID=143900 RepID=A0AAD7SZJ8_9TELE|nr:hypothetical protein AAFF_G00180570 [Aldrovandia affinis]